MQIYKTEMKSDAPHCLAAYLLIGPFHFWWCHWMVNVCDLKDDVDGKPANKQFDSATHEISIMAYNDVSMSVEGDKLLKFEGVHLIPADLVEQIEVDSDEKAVKVFENFMKHIKKGLCSPDSDYRRFNSDLIKRLVLNINHWEGDGF